MNVGAQINSVERTLTNRTLDSGDARVMTLAQTFPTTHADLWDAATNAERIPKWFLPISGNLELGGHYQLEGNAGGTITACDPPNSYSATWEFGGQVSWITATVTPVDSTNARFHLEHVAHVPDDMWNLYGPGAVGIGWDSGLLGLFLSLTSPGERPDDPAAWLVSDDGKQFCRLSADAWRDAQIASGENTELAQQYADASYNAYTATE